MGAREAKVNIHEEGNKIKWGEREREEKDHEQKETENGRSRAVSRRSFE